MPIPAIPAAIRKNVKTRHTFATTALSFGENPLWIAAVMGHCDAEMVIKTYTRLVRDIRGTTDGSSLSDAYRWIFDGVNHDNRR